LQNVARSTALEVVEYRLFIASSSLENVQANACLPILLNRDEQYLANRWSHTGHTENGGVRSASARGGV